MSKEEFRILFTAKSHGSIVKWIEDNTCLQKQTEDSERRFAWPDSLLYLEIKENCFGWRCAKAECYYTFVCLSADIKAKLKELYPKELGHEHIESFNKVIREKNARIKELEDHSKDQERLSFLLNNNEEKLEKIIHGKNAEIKKLEAELGDIHNACLADEINENERLRKENEALKEQSSWSEQKEAELIAAKNKNNSRGELLDILGEKVSRLEEENGAIVARTQEKYELLKSTSSALADAIEFDEAYLAEKD